jgi:hypothetical protein
MVSEYSKINLSRYCSLRQLTQSELGGALNNGECTVYVNTDGSLCLINKENDLVYINRIFNNINNIKIPEFTPPNNINPKTVYALSSVANTFGQFDLSWVEIPTVSENNSTTGSLPTTPQPTKYLLTSTNGTFTGETDNLQKINITNQSLINNLNTNELDDIMIDGDAVLHKNSSDELCLSRKNNSNVSTISFNRNRIFGIEYPQFLNSIPTGNTANCLSAKTISGSTSLNWLPLESTTNNNTGNVFKTANQFLDNYQINKTKIDLSRQTNINVELNTIELINVLKQRDDYNEFILHARNINFNEKLYLTNKFYNNDLTSDYFTLNTIEMGVNQIYDKDIPLFNQNNEDDYILGFIYIGTGSTNTMKDWELSWISVKPIFNYNFTNNWTGTTFLPTYSIHKNNSLIYSTTASNSGSIPINVNDTIQQRITWDPTKIIVNSGTLNTIINNNLSESIIENYPTGTTLVSTNWVTEVNNTYDMFSSVVVTQPYITYSFNLAQGLVGGFTIYKNNAVFLGTVTFTALNQTIPSIILPGDTVYATLYLTTPIASSLQIQTLVNGLIVSTDTGVGNTTITSTTFTAVQGDTHYTINATII